MNAIERGFSRRRLLKILGMASSGIAASRWLAPDLAMAQQPAPEKPVETFTGPGANSFWNSVGPYVTEPQKVPLILLTDRPVQLETPRHYLRLGAEERNCQHVLQQRSKQNGFDSLDENRLCTEVPEIPFDGLPFRRVRPSYSLAF